MVLLIVVFSMSTIAGLILVAVCIVGIPFKYYSDRQKVFELEARVRDIDERLAQQKRIADA
jgi:cell division protein FtsL